MASYNRTSMQPPSALPAAPPSQPVLGEEVRALWALAWPILVGQLANIGMSVAAVAMSGHVSAQDLAGVSLGVSLWNIVIITLIGLLMSVNPTVAHHVGAQELAQVPHVVRQALWKSLLLGILATVALQSTQLIFAWMTLETHTRAVAQDFVLITSFGLPAFAAYRVLYGYSASINQTKPMMVVALLALALNVALSWVLVFGHLGFAPMGGLGCAWATLVSVWFNLIGMLLWISRSAAHQATYPFTHFEWPHRPMQVALFRLGLPIGMTFFAETSAFALIALLVACFGSAQVAAHQIALNFASLLFMVPMSLSVAVLTRVGQALGAGDAQAARYRAWVGLGTAMVFASASAFFTGLYGTEIARFYTEDATVLAVAIPLLFFAAVFQFSDSAQVVLSGAIRGYKVTRAPMLLHLTAFWLVSLPLGYVLGVAPEWAPWRPAQAMQATGFWIALVVALMIAALGLLLMLKLVADQRCEAMSPGLGNEVQGDATDHQQRI